MNRDLHEDDDDEDVGAAPPIDGAKAPVAPFFPELSYPGPFDTEEFQRSISVQFVTLKQDFAALVAMLQGYPDLLARFDGAPFSWQLKKEVRELYRPTCAQLASEIRRRTHFLRCEIPFCMDHPLGVKKDKKGLRTPRPNQWRAAAQIEWLEARPIPLHERDLAFVQKMLEVLAEKIEKLIKDNKYLLNDADEEGKEEGEEDPDQPKAEPGPSYARTNGLATTTIRNTSDELMKYQVSQRLVTISKGLKEDAQVIVSDKATLVQGEGNVIQAMASIRQRKDVLWSRITEMEEKLFVETDSHRRHFYETKIGELQRDLDQEEISLQVENKRLETVRRLLSKRDGEIQVAIDKAQQVIPSERLLAALNPRKPRKKRKVDLTTATVENTTI